MSSALMGLSSTGLRKHTTQHKAWLQMVELQWGRSPVDVPVSIPCGEGGG
jgi:hypothetical protein